MDAIQAALLRVKFKYLDQWNVIRRENAALYNGLFLDTGIVTENLPLEDHSRIVLPYETNYGRHIYHLYLIRTAIRDKLMQYLESHNITTEIYYPVPLHLQECFQYLGYENGDLPFSEAASIQTLALPIYPELTQELIAYTVETIAKFVSQSDRL
jgi:dTDP-4-amino-4,6-dideoxygalactose transaminase